MLKVEYEGADISKDVSVAWCVHDMYATGHSDEVTVKFNDTRHLWDGWGPKAGDKIKITRGAATTGEMLVEAVRPESSLIVIHAMSMPKDAARVVRWKSWEKVKLTQLMTEIASRYGLGYELYGVDDRVYSYVEQFGMTDYGFLARRLALEGAGLITFDGSIVAYSGNYMDTQAPVGTVDIDPGTDYSFSADEDARFGEAEVTDGTFTGTFRAQDGKKFRLVVNDRITDQSEAERFAKGVLRFKNKDTRTLTLNTASFLPEYAAGSVVEIKASAAASWDGPAFVEHIRHDYVNPKSKLWVRQAIGEY